MNQFNAWIAAATLLLADGACLAQDASGLLWKAGLVPCSMEICGGFAQNVATLAVHRGDVFVMPDGTVRIRLNRLTTAGSAVAAANKTLEVWEGSYTLGAFQGGAVNPIGTITTDAHGNYNGTVDTGGGVAFRFAPGTTVSSQFILNDPGLRSEFVTGFKVP